MTRKMAVRAAVASAVIAPAMVFVAGGTATAVPALTAGAAGEVTVTVPAGGELDLLRIRLGVQFQDRCVRSRDARQAQRLREG